MAVLSTAARKNLPGSAFAGPGRSFPVNDRIHAEKALQLVGRSEAAGNVSASQAASIKAKARAKLGAPSNSYAGKLMRAASK
jgi:hypothetical protein